jgi:formate dehydrogenase iron-sulfur subunit
MIIRISDDALARALGADELAAAFEKKGHEVQRTSSWGMQWLEPLVEIDGKGFGPATLEDVDDILEGAASEIAIGEIEKHPFIAGQQRLTFARAGKTRPLSLEDYEATGGWSGLRRARKIGSEQILAEVTQSGLRGRGGAGFPAGIKWQTVARAQGPQKYVVCNADEGDSGTFADRMLMEGDPYCLIEGMTIAAIAGGATKGYIYVRSEYPHSVHVLREAIEIARKANWLGDNIQGSNYSFDLFVRMGAGAYICGEETSMLDSLEGKRGIVRYKPPIPAIEGLFGKPTIINNVMSFAAVPIILSKGGEFYKNYGVGRSRGTLAFQLAGNIKQGGLVEKAFGVTTRQLVEDWGGGTATGRPVRAIQIGGPLGAYIP